MPAPSDKNGLSEGVVSIVIAIESFLF